MLKNLTTLAAVLVALLVALLVRDHLNLPTKTLTIFYTTNLRGQLNPFEGTIEDRRNLKVGGLAFIRGKMDEILKTYRLDPEHVLLLDTGDALFGSAEGSLTFGEAPFNLMVKTGYDAMAVGNMEFEYGLETLRKFSATDKLALLACNYRDVKAPLGNTFLPGKLIEKKGSKIGVIGLGHADLARNTRQEHLLELEITDMKTSVQKTASVLRSQGADLIILLSHHPGLDDRNNLSELFPDADLIIGDLISPFHASSRKRPLVCPTPYSRGAGLGLVRIPYAGGQWNLKKALRKVFIVDSSTITPDKGLSAEIGEIEAQVDTLLEKVLAEANADFEKSYDSESTIGNLLTDFMRKTASAQIGLLNSGGIKMAFPQGTISLRDLFEMLPFENSIVRVELSGWELENLIEGSLSGKGSFLQASGIHCTYSSKNPTGFRVIQTSVGDEPLEFEKRYTVAVSDFMYETHLNWPELSLGSKVSVFGLMREGLRDYLEKIGSITPDLNSRFEDVRDIDETLSLQALEIDLGPLSKPITHENSMNSEFGRMLAESLRSQTDSDFAFVQKDVVRDGMIDIDSLTPSRVVTEIPKYIGVKTIPLPGVVVNKIIQAGLASDSWNYFSGFSLELKDGKVSKIFPWEGDFNPQKIYKVAFPQDFPMKEEGFYNLNGFKGKSIFSDLRRVFLRALRRAGGPLEIRRAVY